MGADLIAYTVVGPPKLKPNKALRKKALTRAGHIVAAALQAEKDPDFDWDQDKFLKNFDEQMLPEIASLDPEQTLNDLLSVWEGNARDSTSRVIAFGKKKVRVLTAGEMSWGDEPDGFGYQTLRDSDRLGFFDVLGIE
jgi:hypothetical protein